MWNALLTVAPGLQRAARVSRASTSAGLFRTDTGEQFAGSGGAHHYVLVKDGGDIERFLRDLHDRCWLHGLGWHLIGGAGQLLDRSVVDRMVAYGERLCFEGAPIDRAAARAGPGQAHPRSIRGRGDRHRRWSCPGLRNTSGTASKRPRPSAPKPSARPPRKSGRGTIERSPRRYRRSPACRLSRRCGWSRRGIGVCSCRTSNWTSITWAS